MMSNTDLDGSREILGPVGRGFEGMTAVWTAGRHDARLLVIPSRKIRHQLQNIWVLLPDLTKNLGDYTKTLGALNPLPKNWESIAKNMGNNTIRNVGKIWATLLRIWKAGIPKFLVTPPKISVAPLAARNVGDLTKNLGDSTKKLGIHCKEYG